MKLYDYEAAPSPRRVRMFLAEKGITVPRVTVDLRAGEHLGEAYRQVNPEGVVPFLVLDDGTGIGESLAICRYFEALQPEPALFGTGALEQALVEMWNRRVELEGYLAVAEALRNATGRFEGRALPGTLALEQIPALAERGRRRVRHFFDVLDARLGRSAYLAGDRFTVADIGAFVTVEFAAWIKESPGDDHPHARRWHAAVAGRPSAGA